MYLSKSIDFLLENAGPVIKYRLGKEILHNLSKTEEENLLEQIYQLPYFKLVESYVKPNGYIGSGAHSWGNWRGKTLHNTPLEDGEAAARLLSYYSIPKTHPLIVNFVNAMRDEGTLRQEFSYIPPEIPRFENRGKGLKSGSVSSDIMVLMYTMQAMLGHGDDDYVKPFSEISLDAFCSLLTINSLTDITNIRLSKGMGYPYIELNTYFPCSYHLTTLAYTKSWRSPKRIKVLANALNQLNEIMSFDNSLSVKAGSKYYGAGWAFVRPLKPFTADSNETVMYRRPLTEIAMLGVGESVKIISDSVINVQRELEADGILRVPKNARKIEYPSAYVDVRLESDMKRKYALECDLTFWAVQFLNYCGINEIM